MFATKTTPTAILMAPDLALGAAVLSMASVSAQSSSAEDSAQSQLTIKISYSKESAGSKLEVEASALGVLDEGLVAKLESPTTLLIATLPFFEVTVEGEEKFWVKITSNSIVDSVELNMRQRW